IRVAVVNNCVEILHRLPDPHAALVQREIFALLLENEIPRLIRVVLPVEFLHDRWRFHGELTELVLLPVGIVAILYEVVPLLKTFERSLHTLRLHHSSRQSDHSEPQQSWSGRADHAITCKTAPRLLRLR